MNSRHHLAMGACALTAGACWAVGWYFGEHSTYKLIVGAVSVVVGLRHLARSHQTRGPVSVRA